MCWKAAVLNVLEGSDRRAACSASAGGDALCAVIAGGSAHVLETVKDVRPVL